MFRVHSVSQRLNLRHLGEPLWRAEGLLEAVSFKKATESMGRGTVANVRWEQVPHSGGCNTKPRKVKIVRTRRTDNLLVFAEHRERVGVW